MAASGFGGVVATTRRLDGVTVLTITNPPVNALASSVQLALSRALRDALSAPGVRAVVLASGIPGYFSGGADVSEFASILGGGRAISSPFTPDATWVYSGTEDAHVPVVAAVPGPCLGGGFELALCCAARVATRDAAFGLPELTLGIIPGLGGTQRLPRLIGFAPAVRMMLYSTVVDARAAKEVGIVDRLVDTENELVDAAAALALELARGGPSTSRVKSIDRTDRVGSAAECRHVAERFMTEDVPKLSRGGALPQYAAVVRTALAGVEKGGRAGLAVEAAEFANLVVSPVSRAIVHMFFASRKTTKIPILAQDPRFAAHAGRSPNFVAVIGGGLMGAGIATAMLQAGMKVIIKEINDTFAASARERVEKNLGPKHASRISNLTVTADYAPLADVEMVIEAALEDPRLKQEIFKTLENICRSDCILATNTSTINIDLIGMACPKARATGRVIGVHFFSPAHKMPLLEVVRTASTSAKVIKDVLAYGKKIRKTPVVVGNCAGFAVNRMYFPQGMVASFLVAEMGQDPYEIDAACEKFGLPMGPFRLLDLVGLDIGVAVGGVFGMSFADRAYESPILSEMVAAGRKGQKTGAGFYKYSRGSRAGVPDQKAVGAFVEKARRAASQRKGSAVASPGDIRLSDTDIVQMILLPCVNEGCRILDEGVSFSTSDLDVCSVMGMAFPTYRGGLMHWAEADVGGAQGVLERLEKFYALSERMLALFKPSFALKRAAAASAAIGSPPKPKLVPGSSSDIVVVSALRTAVGRAGRGGFKDTLPDEMIRPVLKEMLHRTNLSPGEIDDVVFGTVLARGDTGLVQSRVASVLAGLPATVPVKTVNRLCSSGLQAIADAAAAIQAGHYKIAIAGGFESMSSASMDNTELKPNPLTERNKEAMSCYLSMGQTSENVASKFGISRERQDRLAVTSHARAGAAKLAERQASEIVPVTTQVTVIDKQTKKKTGEKTITIAQDEGVRLGVTMGHLAKLPTVFKKGGSTTPGNASQLSDGAAAVVLMTRAEARERGVVPMASLRSFAVAGVDPAVMGIGPVVAIPRALEKAGLTIDDIDLFELNEAFGSQADYCIEKLGLNRDIVNVMGGAIAIGHPLGMTGARMTVSIIHELHRRGGRYGVVSMCVGTGMGAAAIYEINSDDAIPAAKL